MVKGAPFSLGKFGFFIVSSRIDLEGNSGVTDYMRTPSLLCGSPFLSCCSVCVSPVTTPTPLGLLDTPLVSFNVALML